MTLTHRQRMENCLAGGSLDHPPVSLWRHFPVDDQQPDRLARAVAAFQRAFDFDFIKVTPASSYSLKDYGLEDRWEGNPEGTRRYLAPRVVEPEDWLALPLLDPGQGEIARTLQALRLLADEFRPETPVIHTLFSPLAQAKNLVGKDQVAVHLRRYPDALKAGLRTLTENTLRLVEAAAQIPVDGFFYAVQHGQYALLSIDEFESFCRPYDLEILSACRDHWLNVLHLHGEQVMFEQVLDYPVQIINWHDRHTPPSLAEALELFPGAVCGGLRQWETMLLGEAGDVTREAEDALQQTGGKRFVLGTGCVLPTTAPFGNIAAARAAVERQAG